MKLIYLTAKKYPASTADHIFIREMSKAFSRLMGNDFTLIISGGDRDELVGIKLENLGLKISKGLSLYYFFWLLFFIRKNGLNDPETFFFSNDLNLLVILIKWKKIFGYKFKVVSDWHMLSESQLDAYVAHNSDLLVCTTDHLKNLIVNHFKIANTERILVAYGGVDGCAFNVVEGNKTSIKRDLGLPEEVYLVGYIGFYKTMKMSKGLDVMMDALSMIKDRDVRMVFVGGKHDEIEEYRILAQEKGVLERCVFVPVVSSSEVPVYERAMNLLVIPYPDRPHFREYGFPMKAYEYMASGRPIIYSDLPIIAEVLGDCAISFDTNNAKDLADKIIEIKNNPAQVMDLVSKAQKKVMNCTWEKRARKIVDFISLF